MDIMEFSKKPSKIGASGIFGGTWYFRDTF